MPVGLCQRIILRVKDAFETELNSFHSSRVEVEIIEVLARETTVEYCVRSMRVRESTAPIRKYQSPKKSSLNSVASCYPFAMHNTHLCAFIKEA